MTHLRATSARLSGIATPTSWSQVYTSHGEEDVYILLSLSYAGESDVVDLAEIGGSLLETLSETGVVNSDTLADLGHDLSVSVVVASRTLDRLAITGQGDVVVYLFRNGKLGKIFRGSEHLQTFAGTLRADDRFLIATQTFNTLYSHPGIEKLLQEGIASIDSVAVSIHGSDNPSRYAVIISEVMGMVDASPEPTAASSMVHMTLGNWREKLGRIADLPFFRRSIVIQEEKKRWNATIGLTLIGLLALGIFSGMIRRERLVKERAYTQLASSVTQKVTEARSIADLNPERAKVLLLDGRREVDEYLTHTKDKGYTEKARILSDDIKQSEAEVFKKQEVQVTTLIDLSVLQQNLSTNSFYVDATGNLLLPDSQSPLIAGVHITDKSTYSLDLGELGTAKEIATYNKKTYGIVSRGIFEMTSSDKKIAIEPDELWGTIRLIDNFGGNVYLLDTGQSEIWKYPALTDGFGTRRRWLGAGIRLDLTHVVDMKVDGDIWLLTSSGKLERYSRGVPVDFSMEGFPAVDGDRLADPAALYLTENKVYVLERAASRVVVFDKESGKYERQYAAEAMKEARDMVVYEDKGYVLLPDKIVWFPL